MMDIQKLIDTMNDMDSKTRSGYHLTLGGLSDALDKSDPSLIVRFDDGDSVGKFGSYRGHYTDISISAGYPVTVSKFRDAARKAISTTFVGYKGGNYPASTEKPLWKSGYGEASGIAVVGVDTSQDGLFILETKQVD